MRQCKNQIRESLGLAKRSSSHGEPEYEVELWRLTDACQKAELHSFCAGRHYPNALSFQEMDHFSKGVKMLKNEGKVEEWAKRTSRVRSLRSLGKKLGIIEALQRELEAAVRAESEADDTEDEIERR